MLRRFPQDEERVPIQIVSHSVYVWIRQCVADLSLFFFPPFGKMQQHSIS